MISKTAEQWKSERDHKPDGTLREDRDLCPCLDSNIHVCFCKGSCSCHWESQDYENLIALTEVEKRLKYIASRQHSLLIKPLQCKTLLWGLEYWRNEVFKLTSEVSRLRGLLPAKDLDEFAERVHAIYSGSNGKSTTHVVSIGAGGGGSEDAPPTIPPPKPSPTRVPEADLRGCRGSEEPKQTWLSRLFTRK
jgi:hypothetical protein